MHAKQPTTSVQYAWFTWIRIKVQPSSGPRRWRRADRLARDRDREGERREQASDKATGGRETGTITAERDRDEEADADAGKQTHKPLQTHTNTCTHSHLRARTHTRLQTHTHARTHMHAHSPTHAHAHKPDCKIVHCRPDELVETTELL